MDTINGATETAIDNLCTEAEERVSSTSPTQLERVRVEGEIKKIFYEDHSADPQAQKDAIKKMVDDFNTFVNTEGGNYGEFAAREVETLEAVITEQYACFTDQVDN
jgi:hypothetical protein